MSKPFEYLFRVFKIPVLIYRHGWLILVGIFYPISWCQDHEMKNGGYDTLSIRRSAGYSSSTIWPKRRR